ncbi:DUF6507 family protein [Dermacoccus abyssi]|uniref:DUF6507 family protein n=1 Tax=Dermacoccus abyssi TaxID=322596 RepID=UPI0011C22FB9|nr:DUF6507 family protein [Dermacoccus abyssi]
MVVRQGGNTVSYDVDVSQCNVVSNNVATDMKDYDAANKAMGKATQAAATDSKSTLVATAINGYVAHAYNTDVQSISTLTNNARSGLAEALRYIASGDDEMAHSSIVSLDKTDGAGDNVPKGTPAQAPAAKGNGSD